MLHNLRMFAGRLSHSRCLFPVYAGSKRSQALAPLQPQCHYAKRVGTPASEEAISNEPLKYFGSQAASWRARDTRSGGSDTHLWYQPYIISGSLAVFLIYFCVLREESDIDKKLEGSLFDQVSGLEEVQLTVNYKYNKENGLDTREIEDRLAALGIDVQQLEQSRLAEQ